MREAQWWDDSCLPGDMLNSIKKGYSLRKIRLYACAWARQIGRDLTVAREMSTVEVAERFADGQASEKELKAASAEASRLRYLALQTRNHADTSNARGLPRLHLAYQSANAVWEAVRPACRPAFLNTWHDQIVEPGGFRQTMPERGRAQAALLREVFGNPFRPVTLDPRLGTEMAVGLALAAYEERELPKGTLDLVRLGVLADALEEAGCAEPEILEHLRSPGPHVRGCWAVDLVLGNR